MGAVITDKIRRVHDTSQRVRSGPGHAGFYLDASDIIKVNVLETPVTVPHGVLKSLVATGAAAGNVTATGIAVLDTLVSVVMFAAGVPSDLTSEFTITAANVINNTSGTSTNGNKLVVLYFDKTP